MPDTPFSPEAERAHRAMLARLDRAVTAADRPDTLRAGRQFVNRNIGRDVSRPPIPAARRSSRR